MKEGNRKISVDIEFDIYEKLLKFKKMGVSFNKSINTILRDNLDEYGVETEVRIVTTKVEDKCIKKS